MRKRRPSWGPKKLEASLEAEQGGRFPAARTIIGRLERFNRTLNEETIEGGPLRSPEYPDSRLVRRVNHRGIVSFQNTDVRDAERRPPSVSFGA